MQCIFYIYAAMQFEANTKHHDTSNARQYYKLQTNYRVILFDLDQEFVDSHHRTSYAMSAEFTHIWDRSLFRLDAASPLKAN
jgi:hypothetical protein